MQLSIMIRISILLADTMGQTIMIKCVVIMLIEELGQTVLECINDVVMSQQLISMGPYMHVVVLMAILGSNALRNTTLQQTRGINFLICFNHAQMLPVLPIMVSYTKLVVLLMQF